MSSHRDVPLAAKAARRPDRLSSVFLRVGIAYGAVLAAVALAVLGLFLGTFVPSGSAVASAQEYVYAYLLRSSSLRAEWLIVAFAVAALTWRSLLTRRNQPLGRDQGRRRVAAAVAVIPTFVAVEGVAHLLPQIVAIVATLVIGAVMSSLVWFFLGPFGPGSGCPPHSPKEKEPSHAKGARFPEPPPIAN
jgi:hypothetical protein